MKYAPPFGVSDPDAPYINGDESIARQGSILPAAAAEYPQREIVGVIQKNNFTPSDDDLFQLTRATQAQWVNYCVDTGSANALSVALDPPLTIYRQGLPLRVQVANNNTGATTINVNGLGNRPVTRADGAQLEADDLRVGMIALLVDDGTKFQVVNFQGALGGTTNNYFFDIPYAADTDATPNGIAGTYAGLPALVSGDLILVKVNGRNTGAVMFTVNALPAAQIVRTDGQPLQAFDLDHDEILLLVYNVDKWQCLRLVRSQVMFKLNANLTLYVRTDGDDVNGDGSLNTAAKAFQTPQRAIDYVKQSFAIAGRTVTVQLGIPGTYSQCDVDNLPGSIVFRGDPTSTATISSYVIQGPAVVANGRCVTVTGSGSDLTVQGLTFSVIDSTSHFLECDYGAFLTVDNCNFSGVSTSGSCIATTAGQVIVLNNIHIYSNVSYVLLASDKGSIVSGAWYTNFQLHGISYLNSGAFCGAHIGSTVSLYYGYINSGGSSIGYRYIARLNSVIYTNVPGGAQWLPGSVSGNVDSSSVYA